MDASSVIIFNWILLLLDAVVSGQLSSLSSYDEDYTSANVNITYVDETTKRVQFESDIVGKYGWGRVADASGIVVHLRPRNGSHCDLPYENRLPASGEPWIALIQRSECSVQKKISHAAFANATAVVVYEDRHGPTQKMRQRVPSIVVIFIKKDKGEEIAAMVDNGTQVNMSITVGSHQSVRYTNINRTSVLFVSISFIVLMIISLAWLIFYYVQRFRFINAKDQLAKRLCNAAKKALAKIPVKILKESDVSSMECCAVCIEPYKMAEVVRILPCKHQFHKSCVDPWLLEHRTCPMCKMDILKFYGLMYTGSQESILQVDIEDHARFEPVPAVERSHFVVSLPPVGFEVVSVPRVDTTSPLNGSDQSARVQVSAVPSWRAVSDLSTAVDRPLPVMSLLSRGSSVETNPVQERMCRCQCSAPDLVAVSDERKVVEGRDQDQTLPDRNRASGQQRQGSNDVDHSEDKKQNKEIVPMPNAEMSANVDQVTFGSKENS